MADFENFLSESLNGYANLKIFNEDSSKIKTFAFSVDGIVTDAAFCDYSDKQLLIITQFEKVGTLILVTKAAAQSLSGISDVYDVKTICGLDSQDYHLATRYLAEQLDISKPVLFGICLRDVSLRALKGIAKALKENLGF